MEMNSRIPSLSWARASGATPCPWFSMQCSVSHLSLFWRIRQREIKRGAFSERRFYPDLAPITFDDTFTNGQADARTRVSASVKPFEDSEDLLHVFRLDSDAI